MKHQAQGFAATMLVMAACSLETSSSFAANAPKIDFVRDIQPIFRESCYKCHGFDKQKAKLRLASKVDAFKGSKNGPVIMPGNSDKSVLVQRLTTADKDDRMPQEADALSPDKIAKVRAWIDQGAVWPESASDVTKHWAYQKPM